jgi:hypothetical protein
MDVAEAGTFSRRGGAWHDITCDFGVVGKESYSMRCNVTCANGSGLEISVIVGLFFVAAFGGEYRVLGCLVHGMRIAGWKTATSLFGVGRKVIM